MLWIFRALGMGESRLYKNFQWHFCHWKRIKGVYYRLLYFVNTTSSQTRGPELTFTERTMPI